MVVELTPAAEADEAPSLDIVFDEGKARLADQVRHLDKLGDDARFTTTAGTLLLAGFAVVPALVGESSPLERSLMTTAMVIYLGLIIAAVQGFRLRDVTEIANPSGLRDYLHESPEFTKRRLSATLVYAHEQNQSLIDRKARWVNLAQLALVGELVWLVIAVGIRAYT